MQTKEHNILRKQDTNNERIRGKFENQNSTGLVLGLYPCLI